MYKKIMTKIKFYEVYSNGCTLNSNLQHSLLIQNVFFIILKNFISVILTVLNR